jgi:hypothetical protein
VIIDAEEFAFIKLVVVSDVKWKPLGIQCCYIIVKMVWENGFYAFSILLYFVWKAYASLIECSIMHVNIFLI